MNKICKILPPLTEAEKEGTMPLNYQQMHDLILGLFNIYLINRHLVNQANSLGAEKRTSIRHCLINKLKYKMTVGEVRVSFLVLKIFQSKS